MKGFITIIRDACCTTVAASVLLFFSSYGGVAYAAETGGYPWANATLVKASTYDWGYRDCQPEMIQAKTCSAHYGYKDGLMYHQSDPWKYDVRNCTSFVAWRVNQAFQLNLRGWGNAKNWSTVARVQGYTVNSVPKMGDIAVWDGGIYGHVAYVVAVNVDGSVNVEQYNKAGKGEYSRQSRVRANSYIHVAPAISLPPAIEVPVIEPSVVQSVTSALPISPLPEDKEKIVVPEPTQQSTTSDASPVASNPDVSYFIGGNQDKGIKAYAIKHKNTKSGKVEIHTNNITDTTEAWSAEVITPEILQQPRITAYSIADHNGDGIDDMYQISYGNTDSKKVEIHVVDGSKAYSTYLGKWTTEEVQHSPNDVSYTLADSNGDGVLDLYQLWHNNTPDGLVHVKILDGNQGFIKYIEDYVLPETQHDAMDVYYLIGDHNNDGKNDIYQILHNKTASSKVEIRVFDGQLSTGLVMSKWTSETPLYSGHGPSLQNIAP